MTVIIGGSGTANGISYFSSPTTFGGTLATASRGISNASVPAGSVLQVVQSVKTDVFSTTSITAVDITGMAVSITPTSSTSKILILTNINAGAVNSTQLINFYLYRGSTQIYMADAASTRPRTFSVAGSDQFAMSHVNGIYLDSPATTSSTTYKVQIAAAVNTYVAYINRTYADRDLTYYDGRAASSITVMEIAQ